jgi:hypothetical protein
VEWYDILADGYQRVYDTLSHVLDGLSKEDLDWQPAKDSNSIGWTAWHLIRGHDAQISSLMNSEQLWIKDRWYIKFNRKADPDDTGFGHTPKQVSAFKSPDVDTILRYQKAVTDRSKKYFRKLSKSDLDRELDEPWFKPLPTVGVRLVSVLEDGILHAGEASYIRGLRQGKGWQKY